MGGPNDDEERLYLYTADDERILDFKAYPPAAFATNRDNRWTLRGLDGRVLREFRHFGDTWSIERDYIYRGGVLVAAYDGAGNRFHYSNDHLGTPRLVTNQAGATVAFHAYDPFGIELTNPNQDAARRLKFTSHERDKWLTFGDQEDDLDYMHARHFNPTIGRFLSPDPIGGNPFAPQTWNRYSYVLGNPMSYTDPWGLVEEPVDIGLVELINVFGDVFGDEITVTASGLGLGPFPGAQGGSGGPGGGAGGGGRSGTGTVITFLHRLHDLANQPDSSPCSAIAIPPAPPGVDIESNLAQIENAPWIPSLTLGPLNLLAAGGVIAASAPYMPWDFKRRDPDHDVYQNFGNFHFGAAWAATGQPLQVALFGGGLVHTHKPSARGSLWTGPPWGDSLADQHWIRTGYEWYENCR